MNQRTKSQLVVFTFACFLLVIAIASLVAHFHFEKRSKSLQQAARHHVHPNVNNSDNSRHNHQKRSSSERMFLLIAIVFATSSLVPIIGILFHNSCIMFLFALALTFVIFMETMALLFCMQSMTRSSAAITGVTSVPSLKQSMHWNGEMWYANLDPDQVNEFLIRNFKCCPNKQIICCDRQLFASIGVNCTINQFTTPCSDVLKQNVKQHTSLFTFCMIALFWIQIQSLMDAWILVRCFS